jgi:CHASE3 domain sensor protein
MFKNIPIVARLIFLVAAITLLMLATIIYATTDGLRSLARLDEEMQQTLDNVQAFERINFLMADTRIVLLDATLNPEPGNVEKRIAEFQKNRASVTEQSKHYAATLQDDKQRELLESWKAHRATYAKEAIDPLAAALQAGKKAEAERLVLVQVATLNEPIRADIDNIRKYNLEVQEKKTAEVKAASSRTQYLSIALVVALTVVSGLLAWTIIRAISDSLNTLTRTISRIAAGQTECKPETRRIGPAGNQFDDDERRRCRRRSRRKTTN